MTETIRPGVVLPSGQTYYPTGEEWLMAFALAGCGWAKEALADKKRAVAGEPPQEEPKMVFMPWRALEEWRAAAYYAAPLGVQAVSDVLYEVSPVLGAEIAFLNVTEGEGKKIRVVIMSRDRCAPPTPLGLLCEKTCHYTAFEVRNPNVHFARWEDNLAWIKGRQETTPPHLRGLEVNVTQEEYDQILAKVRKDTGYDGLTYGDLWVHKVVGGEVVVRGPFSEPPHAEPVQAQPGTMTFGYLTRAGETAMRKYRKVHNLE